MYNVSNDYINASLDRTREISVKATFNGTIDVDSSDIVSLNFEELCVAGDNPTMGEACSNKIVINMHAPSNPPDYKSGYVEAWVGLTIEEDTIEWCPLGKFYISEYTSDDDYRTVTVTAYDKMAFLVNDFTYTAPTTCEAVVNAIAAEYDFSVADINYPTGNIIDKVVKCTARQMIGYVAGLMGMNARFNRDGELEFFWYESKALVFGDANDDGRIDLTDIAYINENLINKVTDTQYESIMGSAKAGTSYLGGVYDPSALTVDVNKDHIVKSDDVAEIQAYIDGTPYNPTIVGTKDYPYKATQSNIAMGGLVRKADESYTITGLESGSGSNIITSGTTDRVMSFENPFMTQSRLDSIMAGLVFEYMPCTMTYQGNPAFECGDIIGAVASDGNAYAVPIMAQTFSVTGGMSAEVISAGTTEVQSNIETSGIEEITDPLEEAIDELQDMVGEESVAEQIEAMKDEIQANLSGQDGTFSILYNEDGSQRGWKITSTSNPNNCWVFDAGGMRYSNNGGQTFSSVAIDYAGNIVAKNIASNSVISNSVTMSNLSVTGGSVNIDAGGTATNKIVLHSGACESTMSPSTLKVQGTSTTTQIMKDGFMVSSNSGYPNTQVLPSGIVNYDSSGNYHSYLKTGDTVSNATYCDYGLHSNMTSNMYVGVNQSASGNYRAFGYCGRTDFQSWLDASSRRFKHDIKLLTSDWLEQIHGLYNLKVRSWTFNEDHLNPDDEQQGRELIGIIAEELEEVMPNAVLHNKDGEVTSYSDRTVMNAMLVLIQEQKQKIDELEERVKVLENGNI